MKIAVLLGDGMADLPRQSLNGKTPLQVAHTPNMDALARKSLCGMVQTVPEGMEPGSDTANLSVFGYNPHIYYTGRAPLEAINMGIDLGPNDVAFRCNIVDIEDDVMADFSSGHIDTALGHILIEEIAKEIDDRDIELHGGVSYRNILVWRNYPYDELPVTTPPHDISDQGILPHLPEGEAAQKLREIIELSQKIIATNDTIKKAIPKYKGSPTSLWFWGAGKRPSIDTLEERFGLRGHTISAVDLIHGIGRAAGLTPIEVPGVTGYIDTNYEGKTNALIEGIKNADYVYLHVEAPDEASHAGREDHKIQAIEDFDSLVVGPVWEALQSEEDFALLVMPDHPTPLITRTHSSDAVPFCLYRSKGWEGDAGTAYHAEAYNETDAAHTGLTLPRGHELIEMMVHGRLPLKSKV